VADNTVSDMNDFHRKHTLKILGIAQSKKIFLQFGFLNKIFYFFHENKSIISMRGILLTMISLRYNLAKSKTE